MATTKAQIADRLTQLGITHDPKASQSDLVDLLMAAPFKVTREKATNVQISVSRRDRVKLIAEAREVSIRAVLDGLIDEAPLPEPVKATG